MTVDLDGRRILVTGAASGIGMATVRRLIGAGARVACLDRNRVALSALSTEIDSPCFEADVTKTAAVESAVSWSAEQLDGLDGLVNAAGIDLVKAADLVADEEWEQILGVNLSGPMKMCRAAIPFLRQAGSAAIVNISSAAGLQPLRHRSAYCASKAALQMYSKALAMELAESRIRVNVVCPGAVDTALFHSSIGEGDGDCANRQLAAIRDRYAMARIAEPDEIAAAVVWLISDEASYVTGVALAVDGGRTFH